jgi:hypothetical protein
MEGKWYYTSLLLVAGLLLAALPVRAEFVYFGINTKTVVDSPNTLVGYRVDSDGLGTTGALTPIKGSPFAVGKAPAQFIFAGSL